MTTDTRLTAAIDAIINEKTFSLEGLRAIEEVRSKANMLEVALKSSLETVDSLGKEVAEANAENAKLKAQVNAAAVREAEITIREAKIAELEKSAAVAQAEAKVFDKCFERVFANRTVREQTYSSVPVWEPYSGGGGHVSTHSTSGGKIVEEG